MTQDAADHFVQGKATIDDHASAELEIFRALKMTLLAKSLSGPAMLMCAYISASGPTGDCNLYGKCVCVCVCVCQIL